MYGLLLALLVLDGLFLMTVILLQSGKGGGAAARPPRC
jgi:preprotein translocase subunit SecG